MNVYIKTNVVADGDTVIAKKDIEHLNIKAGEKCEITGIFDDVIIFTYKNYYSGCLPTGIFDNYFDTDYRTLENNINNACINTDYLYKYGFIVNMYTPQRIVVIKSRSYEDKERI